MNWVFGCKSHCENARWLQFVLSSNSTSLRQTRGVRRNLNVNETVLIRILSTGMWLLFQRTVCIHWKLGIFVIQYYLLCLRNIVNKTHQLFSRNTRGCIFIRLIHNGFPVGQNVIIKSEMIFLKTVVFSYTAYRGCSQTTSKIIYEHYSCVNEFIRFHHFKR